MTERERERERVDIKRQSKDEKEKAKWLKVLCGSVCLVQFFWFKFLLVQFSLVQFSFWFRFLFGSIFFGSVFFGSVFSLVQFSPWFSFLFGSVFPSPFVMCRKIPDSSRLLLFSVKRGENNIGEPTGQPSPSKAPALEKTPFYLRRANIVRAVFIGLDKKKEELVGENK